MPSRSEVYEIGSNAIRIISIVIVRVAVRVDIAEIIGVVVISRTQPPISASRTTQNEDSEIHPYIIFIFSYRFL